MSTLGCNRNITVKDTEVNPKTIPLAKLVTQIEPKLLSYYLEQVAVFLKNKKKDLWFPLISLNLEAFLVRIIQNTQNLKSLLHLLDGKSRELCIDIIETIEANKNVYTVVHNYSSSSVSKNILVYRKVLERKLPDVETVISQLEKLCPPKTRYNRSEIDENVDPVAAEPPGGKEILSKAFKKHWIDATIFFIKDSTVDCLEYPDMNIEQSEYVYSLVQPGKLDRDFDPSSQEECVPLKEALKEFNKTHELKSTFTYLSGNRVRLGLEKVPLINNKRQQKKLETEKSSKSPENSHQTKNQKQLPRKTEIIKLLEPSFIRTSLSLILDFINEPAEGSIVFKNADTKQWLFLQSVLATAKTKKLHDMFSPENRTMLRKIATYLASADYDLKIELRKMERKCSLRAVALCKVPKETMPPLNPVCKVSKETTRPGTLVPCSAQSRRRSPSVDSPRESPNWRKECRTSKPNTNLNTSTPIENSKVSPKCGSNDNIKNEKGNTEKSITANQKPNNKVDSTVKSKEEPLKPAINGMKVHQTKDNKEISPTPSLKNGSESKTIENGNKELKTKCKEDSVFKSKEKTVEPAINGTKEDRTKDNTKANPPHSLNNGTIENETSEIEKTTDKTTIGNIKPENTSNVLAIDNTAEQVKTANNRTIDKALDVNSGKGLGLRKMRLIEGLSTPLESDVAMRMMRQMGWEGGPLGVRGDGLTEPVIPAIHLKVGAGLGHVAPKKEPKPSKAKPLPPKIIPSGSSEPDPPAPQPKLSRTIHCHKPPNVRLDILRHILHLIIEEPLERIVVYSTKLAKKDMKFLDNTVKAISRKGVLIFNDNDMQDTYGRIIDEVIAAPKLQLTHILGNDKNFVLRKNDIPHKPKNGLLPTPNPITALLPSSQSKRTPLPIPQLNTLLPVPEPQWTRLPLPQSNTTPLSTPQTKTAPLPAPQLKTAPLPTPQPKTALLPAPQPKTAPLPKPQPKTSPPNEPPPETALSIAYEYISAKFITTEIIYMLGKQLTPARSIKSAKTLGHNIIVLATILDLLQSQIQEKVVKFDYPITCKKVEYIRTAQLGIYYRNKWSCSTKFEQFLATEILNSTSNDLYVYAVYLCNNQHITFKKMRHTRSINKIGFASQENDIENNEKDITKDNIETQKNVVENNKNDITKVNCSKDNTKKDAKTADNDEIEISDSDDESVDEAHNNGAKTNEKSENNASNSSIDTELKNDGKKNEENAKVNNNVSDEIDNKTTGFSNGAISKRSKNNSNESNKNEKANNIKYLGIAPDSYPMENVGVDDIITFQNKVLEKLENIEEKPLLECLGIKNGAIIYCCHNDFGKYIIEDAAADMGLNTMNITNLYNKSKPYKVDARINSFVEVNMKDLFEKVETYNYSLKTDMWFVTDVRFGNGYVTLSLEIDEASFEYISRNNFSIFAGIDKMRFSVKWD